MDASLSLPKLYFARMAPDAQEAAIRRLALKGFSVAAIAAQTGWSADRIEHIASSAYEVSPVPVRPLKTSQPWVHSKSQAAQA